MRLLYQLGMMNYRNLWWDIKRRYWNFLKLWPTLNNCKTFVINWCQRIRWILLYSIIIYRSLNHFFLRGERLLLQRNSCLMRKKSLSTSKLRERIGEYRLNILQEWGLRLYSKGWGWVILIWLGKVLFRRWYTCVGWCWSFDAKDWSWSIFQAIYENYWSKIKL